MLNSFIRVSAAAICAAALGTARNGGGPCRLRFQESWDLRNRGHARWPYIQAAGRAGGLLAGIAVPPDRASAKDMLERLLAGGTVVLKQSEPAEDRYGRLLVQAYVSRDGVERWIQGELLGNGDAQVSGRPGDAACAKALRSAEAQARGDRRGLWADSAYSIKASDDLIGLLARRGQFTIAEGKIFSVRESGGTLYINFGRVWSRNLAVTILRRNRPKFESAGLDQKKLEGAYIRVRGWVEERGGPRIEAARPEQIEIAAQD